MDRNGYNPSIMQDDLSRCYWCGRSCEKLDRHEIFGASNRSKSKEMGLWVLLCHQTCHLNGVHSDKFIMDTLHKRGQIAAMETYHLSTQDFINRFGRNYL